MDFEKVGANGTVVGSAGINVAQRLFSGWRKLGWIKLGYNVDRIPVLPRRSSQRRRLHVTAFLLAAEPDPSAEKANAMSRKTLRRVVLGTLPILGALAVWVAWQLSPWGQLGYVAKQTQLDLPLFPSNLHVYDDAEMTVTAHLTVSRDRVAELLQDQRFRSVATNPYPRPFRLMSPQDLRDVSYLPVQFRSLAHGARLYQAGGCSDGTAWSGILDDESGSLWLEVQYPDMAGDRPPCRMDAVHAAEHLQDSVPAP